YNEKKGALIPVCTRQVQLPVADENGDLHPEKQTTQSRGRMEPMSEWEARLKLEEMRAKREGDERKAEREDARAQAKADREDAERREDRRREEDRNFRREEREAREAADERRREYEDRKERERRDWEARNMATTRNPLDDVKTIFSTVHEVQKLSTDIKGKG